ncbi:hypothetical protein ACU4GA_13810 [Methylobacterium oryzae CBMB20]
MVALYTGKTPQEAAGTDGLDLFRQLRFGAHVTPKRLHTACGRWRSASTATRPAQPPRPEGAHPRQSRRRARSRPGRLPLQTVMLGQPPQGDARHDLGGAGRPAPLRLDPLQALQEAAEVDQQAR